MPFNQCMNVINKRLTDKVVAILSEKEKEHQIIAYEHNDEIRIIDVSEHQTEYKVGFSLKKFLEHKDELSNKEVYVAHNHPSGSLKPSMGDYNSHTFLLAFFRFFNIKIIEEIIVAGGKSTSYFLPETKKKFIEHPKTKISSYAKYERTDILKNNTLEELKKFMQEQLLNDLEVIIGRSRIFISNYFSIEDLLKITDYRNEVCFYGSPTFGNSNALQRIKDIERVFGSIEFFSLKSTGKLISLKKETVI